jgi:hypothetical protein
MAEDLRAQERQSGELFHRCLERIGMNATWEPVTRDPPDLSFTIAPDYSPPEFANIGPPDLSSPSLLHFYQESSPREVT